MRKEGTPSAVMFADFKAMGISNRAAALILLDGGKVVGDTPLRARIESRPVLSRDIVHAAPGGIDASWFVDFRKSVPMLAGELMAARQARGGVDAAPGLAAHYSGPAMFAMSETLAENDIDGAPYRNAVARVVGMPMRNEAHRVHLLLLLFTATGCTGDPLLAARLVRQYAEVDLGADFQTPAVECLGKAAVGEEGSSMGLMRLAGGRLAGSHAHRLAPTLQGTELGSLPASDDGIVDVEADVSARHLRIYRDGGQWFAVGLHSTNGTTVVSGADKREYVVEPPRYGRASDYAPQPVEIFPTDIIRLGSATRFLVVPLSGD